MASLKIYVFQSSFSHHLGFHGLFAYIINKLEQTSFSALTPQRQDVFLHALKNEVNSITNTNNVVG